MLNRPHQKLRIHKQIDALYKWKNNIDFIPPFVEISPISYCNQECKFCYTTHLMQKLEKMPTEVFLKLVRNLGESGVKGLRLQGIGEPTLHPDLGKAINVAGEFNLETALTTNGVLMREKLLNECLENLFSIKISVMDSDPKRYSDFHRVNINQWKTIVKNIEYAANLISKNNYKCTFHTTIYAENSTYENLMEITSFCKKLGFNLVTISNALYSPRTPSPQSSKEDFKIDHEKYLKDLENELKTLDDKKFLADVCLRNIVGKSYVDETKKINCPGVKFSTVIDAKGYIYPCWRYWGKTEYSYGNVSEENFSDIWMSPKRHEINNKMMQEYYREKTCSPCSHNRINEQLKELETLTGWENFLS